MKIKKFVGRSFQEAFNQMKEELGEDAIILNSRTIKSGDSIDFAGRRATHEITAAVDRVTKEPVLAGEPDQNLPLGALQPAYRRPAPGNFSRASRSGDVPAPKTAKVVRRQTDEKILAQLGQIHELRDEIQDMRKVLTEVADFLKYSRMPALPKPFKNLLKNLVNKDVHEDLAKALVQTVYARTDAADYQRAEVIQKNLLGLLERMIRIGKPVENVKRRPYVVSLIGPTGVGKTTTIAKLAANAKLRADKKVALISADTYRIAAIEQLQTFANIANIPMSVAYSPEEMREAIFQFRQKDIIFIDTVGRSQKHEQHLRDLQKFVDAANPDEVHLVLSLTSGLKTVLDVMKRFSIMRPNRLIFSKLDEAANSGNILNVLYKHQIPVSYLTTGQTVPNDILPAGIQTISRAILNGSLN